MSTLVQTHHRLLNICYWVRKKWIIFIFCFHLLFFPACVYCSCTISVFFSRSIAHFIYSFCCYCCSHFWIECKSEWMIAVALLKIQIRERFTCLLSQCCCSECILCIFFSRSLESLSNFGDCQGLLHFHFFEGKWHCLNRTWFAVIQSDKSFQIAITLHRFFYIDSTKINVTFYMDKHANANNSPVQTFLFFLCFNISPSFNAWNLWSTLIFLKWKLNNLCTEWTYSILYFIHLIFGY